MALVEGALVAKVKHWPSATEVSSVPLDGLLVRTSEPHLSILTGRVISRVGNAGHPLAVPVNCGYQSCSN